MKKSVLVFILILIAFGGGIVVGQTSKLKSLVTGDGGNIEIVKVLNLYSKTRSSEVKFDQFWDLWNLVKNEYVDQPVDDTKLFYGALQGIVQGLGDPHSIYFPPKEAAEFAKDLSGKFEGIGAQIGIKEDVLIIVGPLAGSPAEKAGLKTGDKIYKIDDVESFNLSVDEAINKIRGPKGTNVKLTIVRDGVDGFKEINIVRDTINIPSVAWEKKDNQIAYLALSYFNENTWEEFDKIVKEIKVWGPKGIILDMRSNPGGYLDTAVAVTSEWVKEGVIVKEKFSQGKEDEYKTTGAHRFLGIPTIVLVDEGSASGSEIVAGALQDYGVAKLVGKKTYGKGSVQNFEPLPDGSALKLTVARWYTPKDRGIDKLGIAPDVEVKEMFVKEGEGEKATYKDMGLEKALELLK